MRHWLPLLAILALAGCAGTPKKAQDAAGTAVAGTPAAGATAALPPGCSGTSPYAAAQEDPSTRGDYKAGGLYKPGVKDSTPDYIPNVDCIPEPRVVDVPRSPVGNRSPYTVLGKQYHVMDKASGYVERGTSSYYGAKFHGRRTSNQEVYDMYAFTAAHRSLPLPSYARVTNLDNGKSVVVRVNDRGPFHSNRLIDLSYAAAVKLGYRERGTANVEVRALTPGEEKQVARQAPAASPPPARDAVAGVVVATSEYRFDMQQDGRVMTAAEFDTWMRARRVRVATGKPGKPDPLPDTSASVTTAALPVPADGPRASAPPPADLAPAPVVPAGSVQLQVASFASPANAERALAMLRNAGVPGARLQDATVGGKRIWRLRVGPLAENAVSPLALRIAGLGFGQPTVVRE